MLKFVSIKKLLKYFFSDHKTEYFSVSCKDSLTPKIFSNSYASIPKLSKETESSFIHRINVILYMKTKYETLKILLFKLISRTKTVETEWRWIESTKKRRAKITETRMFTLPGSVFYTRKTA